MLCHRWIAQCNHWTEWLTNTTDQVSAYIHDIQYNDLHGVKQIQLLNSGMTANTDQQYKITNDWWLFVSFWPLCILKVAKWYFFLLQYVIYAIHAFWHAFSVCKSWYNVPLVVNWMKKESISDKKIW